MRKVLVAGLAVLLLIFTVLVALPSFIELNRYKGKFETTLEKALQRPVKMGDIRLGLLFGPSLRVSDVAISDREEFGGQESVAMEEMEVRIALLPLLSRRIVVRKMVAHHPSIRLTIAEDGRTNFSDLIKPEPEPRGEPPREPAPPREAPAARGAGLTVSRFDVRGGTVTVVDRHTVAGTTLTHRLEDLDIFLRDVSFDSPIGFDLSGAVVRDTRQTFHLKGRVGPVSVSPDPAKLPITISVVSKGLELAPLQPYVGDLLPIKIRSGSVTSDVSLTRRLHERLEAKGSVRFEDMDFTATASGYSPPKPLSLALDHSVRVDLESDTIEADHFRLTIGGSKVDIAGKVTQARTSPRLDLSIKSDGLALGDLVRLDPALPSRLPQGLGVSGPMALDVDYEGSLSAFSARGFVDATRAGLAWKKLVDKASGVPAALRFEGSYDGKKLTIGRAHLELHSMKLDTSGSVTNLSSPSMKLKLSTNEVSLDGWEKVLPVLKKNPLRGRFSFTAEVEGSTAEPAKSQLDVKLALREVGPVERLFTIAPALKASWPRDLDLAGTASADIDFQGTMDAFEIDGQMDLRNGNFRYGSLLEKPRGEQAQLKLKGRYAGGDVTVENIDLALKDLQATGKGSIKDVTNPFIDIYLSTEPVDVARWAPAGRSFVGRLRLALGAKGWLNKPEALSFTKVELEALGLGPLEKVMEALPSLRASLPEGFKLDGIADASVSFSGTYPKLSGRAEFDLTRAGLRHPDWVVKPSGSPARLLIDGSYTGEALTLKSFEVALGEDWVRGAAHLVNLDKPRGSLSLASSTLEMEELSRTLPLLSRYGLAGSVSVDVQLRGDTERLKEAQAKGRVELRRLQTQIEQLPAPLKEVTGTLELSGQEANLKQFTVVFGDNIVRLNASVRGFDAPTVDFILDSPSLNLHQLKPQRRQQPKALAGPPPPGGDRGTATKGASQAGGRAGSDGWFGWIKKVTATGRMRVQRAVYEDWVLSNLQAKTSLRRGIFLLNHLTFGLHGGRYDGSAVLDLDPASGVFSFQSSLNGVDVNELLSTHADLPNTVWGRLQANLDIKGRANAAQELLPTISGQGQLTVTDGHMNMALVRDLLNNMPVLKLVGLIPGFQKLNYCTRQFTSQDTTPFRYLILPVSLNRGVAAVAPSTLVLDSKDIDVVTGPRPGVIDLPRQEIHLRDIRAVFSPELTDMCLGSDAKPLLADAAGRMTFPFAMDGSFRDGRFPKPRPDERFLLETIQKAMAGQFLNRVLGGGSSQPAPQQPGQSSPQTPLPGGSLEDLLKIIK